MRYVDAVDVQVELAGGRLQVAVVVGRKVRQGPDEVGVVALVVLDQTPSTWSM